MSKNIPSSDRTHRPKELPDFHLVRKTELIFRALNHKLRQQILTLLLEHNQLTVTELFTHLKLEQSVASQHLATLRRTGFVVTKKEGKFVWYMLKPERLAQIEKAVALLNGSSNEQNKK